ncbi:ATP phosphoribosyltransferase regulatory subunit [Enterococcus sp. LJL98]
MKWNRSLPNGTKDKLFKEAVQSHQLESMMNHHFESRGYQRIETPLIEFEEVFDGMDQKATSRYRFFDDQGRIVVLRPDMTLPIGRVISTTGVIPPVQLFYSGKVFRVNKGHSGEYNEQLQAGMELIGYDSLKAETECLINGVALTQKSGIFDFQIEIGHAAIYQRIVSSLHLTKVEEKQFKWVLQSKNTREMQIFLKAYQAHVLYPLVSRLPRLFGEPAILDEVKQLTSDPEILMSIQAIETLIARIQQVYPEQEVTVDIGLVQEFKYYTGITFKGYSDQTSDCFFSGGRYDELLTEFSVEPLPAVGLVFYLDRMLYLKNRKGTFNKLPGIQTLVFFEDDALLLAEETLAQESLSRFSLYATLEETLQHAQKWQIPRVLHVKKQGVKEIRIGGVKGE